MTCTARSVHFVQHKNAPQRSTRSVMSLGLCRMCCPTNRRVFIGYSAYGKSALQMPFIKKAPRVSFRKPIGSVSVSGHKFIGAPVPCGVVITRQKVPMHTLFPVRYAGGHWMTPTRGDVLLCTSCVQCSHVTTALEAVRHPADAITALQYVAALSNDVEYLNSRDATIMGSRNGHAPIYMWFTLTRKGYEGMRKDVERCLRNAHLLKVPPTVTRSSRARCIAAKASRGCCASLCLQC